MPTKRNHGRAPDKVHLSLVLPEELLDKIEKIKIAEQRNRNNLLVRMLTRQVELYMEATALKTLAETGPQYRTNPPPEEPEDI